VLASLGLVAWMGMWLGFGQAVTAGKRRLLAGQCTAEQVDAQGDEVPSSASMLSAVFI
jgi:hypothetical protein